MRGIVVKGKYKVTDSNKRIVLSEQEFETLLPNIMDKFTGKSLQVAKLMWVEGMTAIEAGKTHGMSKQSASALGIRLERARAEAPEGWVALNLYAPPELAKEVKARVKALREAIAKASNV